MIDEVKERAAVVVSLYLCRSAGVVQRTVSVG